VLGKLAAGVGLLAFLPVLFIAAAAGSLKGGGAPTAVGVVCGSGTGGSGRPSAAPSAPSSRPCQAGELEAMVLTDPRIGLQPEARGDVAAGRIDPRVLEVLLFLAERHDLSSVGPLITGHSYYVRGTTRPSNHAFGRAMDIPVIDGVAVSIADPAALDAMEMIMSLPPPFLPDELGGPWLLHNPSVRTFTKDHGDHIHIGWDTKSP
jgi:hypothetical protein